MCRICEPTNWRTNNSLLSSARSAWARARAPVPETATGPRSRWESDLPGPRARRAPASGLNARYLRLELSAAVRAPRSLVADRLRAEGTTPRLRWEGQRDQDADPSEEDREWDCAD